MREKPLLITMEPGLLQSYYQNQNYLAAIFFLLFYLQFIHLPLSDLILASNEFKGIDNPLARVGCKYLFVCVCAGTVDSCLCESPIGSINLGSLLREILSATILHHPSFPGKFQRLSQVAKEFLALLPGRLPQTTQGPFIHIIIYLFYFLLAFICLY